MTRFANPLDESVLRLVDAMREGAKLTSKLYGGGQAELDGRPLNEKLMARAIKTGAVKRDMNETRVDCFVWTTWLR